MTRKNSNVKALALAVTCAILTGGGIGLEPVYAEDVLYKETSGNVTTAAKTDEKDNTIIKELTVGGVKIGSEDSFTGISISGSSTNNHVTISDNGMVASGGVFANIIDSGLNARMSDGNVVAKNGLYIGYTSQLINGATYDNSTFAVNGKNGSFKAANGAFNVSDSGAITADSLTLTGSYDVKQNIEEAKGRINTVESDLNTNKDNLTALQGRVDNHDTEIGALKTKTQGITRVEGNSTTVEGVNFKDGAVSGVKSINGRIKISTDGKTVTFNEGVGKGQVIISENGIKVGTGSTYVSGDAVYTGGADYDTAKAGMKKDGSLKATGFAVDGENGNTTVGGDLTVDGAATFTKETTFANGIKTDTISEKTNDAGVTVDGVVLKDGGITADGNVTTTGDIQGANITATGALKGQTLGIGGTGNDQFTVDENGAVKAAGGKVKIDENGNAWFGDTGVNITKIEGNKITTGRIETSDTLASNIGGVTLQNGQITAKGMTIDGAINLDDLTVKNKLNVGDFSVDKTGAVTDLKSINGVTVANSGTGLTIGSATIGDANPFSSTGFKVDNVGNVEAVKVTAGTITDGAGFTAAGGNVTATGTVKGKTIYDGVGAKLENGEITAQEGKIGNVVISAAGEVTGVKSIKASTFKVDEENYLNSNGITAKGGKIGGAVIDATTLSVGSTKLDKADGITTNKLKIDGMTLTDTKLDTGTATFEVNGVTFNQGQVTANAAQGFVAGTSSFKEGSLIVDANNKLEATNGLTTGKATVNGTLDVTGNATFGTAGSQTTIEGDAITTDTLKANKLILGASGAATVVVDKDGSLKAADGKFVVDKDGALKAANGAFNVDKDGKTTFKKDDNNLSSINGGNIWAKATDVDNHTSSVLQHDSKGLHVKGNNSGQKSAFDFDTASGIGTFTGQDSTTTTINGSAITSTKAAGNTGVLDGS